MATYIDLQKQIAALQKEADALREQERAGVIDRMKEAISVYELTPEDLGFSSFGKRTSQNKGRGRKSAGGSERLPKKSPGTAAYSDSQGNTWGGRGPRPKWLRDALASGSDLQEFARTKK